MLKLLPRSPVFPLGYPSCRYNGVLSNVEMLKFGIEAAWRASSCTVAILFEPQYEGILCWFDPVSPQ